MTATIDLVDEFLSDVRHLSLIDADKVRDFLLDLRLLLAVPFGEDANGYRIGG